MRRGVKKIAMQSGNFIGELRLGHERAENSLLGVWTLWGGGGFHIE
jgi:hypothetical protein